MNQNLERITIKENQICVISSLAGKDDVKNHGIYEVDDKVFLNIILENIIDRLL